VALLLASALPLLADETIAVVASAAAASAAASAAAVDSESEAHQPVPIRIPINQRQIDEDEHNEHDRVALSAAEAIHNDGFKLPSLHPTGRISEDEEEEEEDSPEEAAMLTAEEDNPQTTENQQADSQPNRIEKEEDDDDDDEDAIDPTSENVQSEEETETIPITSVDGEEEDSKSKKESTSTTSNESETTESDDSEEIKNKSSGFSEDIEPATTTTTTTTATTESEEETSSSLDNSTATTDTNTDAQEVSEEIETATATATNTEIETPPEEELLDEDDDNNITYTSVDYASKSAGALIIEKSSSFKGTSNLLNGDKDKYAIAPCEDKKFVVVSLSEDILVKQIKLANYERFSSSVKEFQVMGSQTLGKWFEMGTYMAKNNKSGNINGEQVFDLLEPAWARYLKFKFLSHHGVEYYCTYSQIKVHGSTMVQGFHEQWEESEENEESELLAAAAAAEAEGEESGVAETHQDSETSLDTAEPEATDSSSSSEGQDETDQDSESTGTLYNKDKDTQSEESHDHPSAKHDDHGVQSAGSSTEDTLKSFSATSPNLGKFHTSRTLDELLHGAILQHDDDDQLLSELYDLIPTALSSLPQTSRDSPGRRTTTDGDIRSLHQLGTLAMESIYSSSRIAADAAKAIIAETTSGTIVAPKMSDRVGGIVSQYFGSEMGTFDNNNNNDNNAGHQSPGEQGEDRSSSHAGAQKTQAQEANKLEEEASQKRQANDYGALPNKTEEASTKKQTEDEKTTDSIGGSEEEKNSPSTTQAAASAEGGRDPKEDTDPLESTRALDLTLATMLENLPSAECLSKLDFAEFKAKILASRKSASGTGASHNAGTVEPIFKKLTDEIKSLQTSLSIQDQFTKTSVACYQRVLLDLIIEMEKVRSVQGDRLQRLEEQFRKSQTWFLWTLGGRLLSTVSSVYSWMYSALLFLYSWLYLWTSTLLRFGRQWTLSLLRFSRHLPGKAYRQILQFWPNVKTTLLSTERGSELAKAMSPFISHMDQLVDDVNHPIAGPESDQPLWTFPIVPTILAILVGRLVMCFAGSGTKSVDAKRSPAKTLRENPTRKKSDESLPDLAADIDSASAETPSERANRESRTGSGRSLVTP
jgi:hypothetical protein